MQIKDLFASNVMRDIPPVVSHLLYAYYQET